MWFSRHPRVMVAKSSFVVRDAFGRGLFYVYAGAAASGTTELHFHFPNAVIVDAKSIKHAAALIQPAPRADARTARLMNVRRHEIAIHILAKCAGYSGWVLDGLSPPTLTPAIARGCLQFRVVTSGNRVKGCDPYG